PPWRWSCQTPAPHRPGRRGPGIRALFLPTWAKRSFSSQNLQQARGFRACCIPMAGGLLVFLSVRVMGVQHLVGPVAAGLAEVFAVQRLHDRALVGFAQHAGGVALIQGLAALLADLIPVAGQLDGLAAAVDAAAGAGHDLDEVV